MKSLENLRLSFPELEDSVKQSTKGGWGGYSGGSGFGGGGWGNYGGFGNPNNPFVLDPVTVTPGNSNWDNPYDVRNGSWGNPYNSGWGYPGQDYGGGGGGGYIASEDTPGDPFMRINGQLIVTATGKKTDIDYIYENDPYDDVILNFEEVNVKDYNGNDVLAYRVVSYQTEPSGVKNTDVPDRYKSNCHGSALGVDLWFNDIYDPNLRDVNIKEDQGFKTMMDGYSSNFSDSNVISFYEGGLLKHSVQRNPITGEIWSKTDQREGKHYADLNAFFADENNADKYVYTTRKYYAL